jgi:hypothetical protein
VLLLTDEDGKALQEGWVGCLLGSLQSVEQAQLLVTC